MATMQEAYKNLLQKRIDINEPYYNIIDCKLHKPIYLTNKNIKEFNDHRGDIHFDDFEDTSRYWEVEHLYKRLIITLQSYEILYRDFSDNDFDFKIQQPAKIKEGKRTYNKVKFEWHNYPITEDNDERCIIYARLY